MAKAGSTTKRLEQLVLIRTSRGKTIGFTIFSIIVLLVLIGGAVVPSVSTIINVQSEIREKKAVLGALEDKASALSKLSQQYDSLGYVVPDLPLLYPNTGDYSMVTANLDEILKEFDFNMQAIGFLDDREEDSDALFIVLKPQVVSISTKGPVVNFVPMIKAIEEMPMRPEVRRVSFSYTPDENGLNEYSLQIFMHRIEDELFYD